MVFDARDCSEVFCREGLRLNGKQEYGKDIYFSLHHAGGNTTIREYCARCFAGDRSLFGNVESALPQVMPSILISSWIKDVIFYRCHTRLCDRRAISCYYLLACCNSVSLYLFWLCVSQDVTPPAPSRWSNCSSGQRSHKQSEQPIGSNGSGSHNVLLLGSAIILATNHLHAILC